MTQPKGLSMTALNRKATASSSVATSPVVADLGATGSVQQSVSVRTPVVRMLRAAAASGLAFGMLAALAPTAAHAQPASNCPPGSWFCAEASGGISLTPPTIVIPGGLQPLPPVVVQQPPPVVVQPAPPPVVYQPQPQPSQPVYVRPGQRVMVQNGGSTTVIINGGSGPAPSTRPYTPPPPPGVAPMGFVVNNTVPEFYHDRELGINLSIQGALIGAREESNGRRAGMSGFGLGLRYKPIPQYGFEAQFGGYGGTDAAGRSRSEAALQLNAMVFFNTRQRFQPYLLGGIGFSSARVSDDVLQTYAPDGSPADRFAASRGGGRYGYVGLQAGIGADYRLGAHFALNLDIRGFVRGRTDSNGGYEFINSKGQATNTSGGGLVSLGATYYF